MDTSYWADEYDDPRPKERKKNTELYHIDGTLNDTKISIDIQERMTILEEGVPYWR